MVAFKESGDQKLVNHCLTLSDYLAIEDWRFWLLASARSSQLQRTNRMSIAGELQDQARIKFPHALASQVSKRATVGDLRLNCGHARVSAVVWASCQCACSYSSPGYDSASWTSLCTRSPSRIDDHLLAGPIYRIYSNFECSHLSWKDDHASTQVSFWLWLSSGCLVQLVTTLPHSSIVEMSRQGSFIPH